MKKSHAFTLIELMMVVAIIGILMSILFPFIAIVRDSAYSVRCTSALRQVGMGYIYYAQANRGYVADSYTGVGGIAWNQLIDSYLDTQAATFKDTSKLMWECPMWRRHPSVQIYNEDPNSDWWRVFGFGANSKLNLHVSTYLTDPDDHHNQDICNDRWYNNTPGSFRFESISFRSNRVLAGDSTNNRLVTNVPALTWPLQANGFWSHCEPDRHHGRANYLFCDIHAASLTPDQAMIGISDPEYLP